MLAYDEMCKQRWRVQEMRRKKAAGFTEDGILAALESVHQAMGMAKAIVHEAETAHFEQFLSQLATWGIDPRRFAPEPYLDAVKRNFEYQFIRSMEKLFIRLESYLHDVRGTAKKTGISLYAGDSAAMRVFDSAMGWKAFTSKEPLLPRVNQCIITEAERVQHRLRQNLDAQRQAHIGVREYIWRSRDDDKVRSAHAAHDDRVFRWDSPPEGGHPGEAYGCRCYAEPTIPIPTGDTINDPPIEPAYPELLFIGIGRAAWVPTKVAIRGIASITAKVADRIARLLQPKLRRDYERDVRDLVKVERQMRKEGYDVETIAREMSRQRRALGVKYKDLTPEHLRPVIRARNIRDYGDELGPTIRYFRNRGDSWEKIIEKAKTPGRNDLRKIFRQ